ncbi:MAG: UDP-N-acetylglucosamine 2-epimerase (non-hydrolyzing) [Melioribacteraceae bacterium]|nr:UDP-N-acetylglucosamine 2-epimerase (non-hydrolyzing) [Melioribacteraceae bacterium]MCF8264838.1 UDP-N-acetylglucosamine 2-epimerase (non-hydrolyzing) [Melioribacteraceae bacterium]MCF8431755.1 UDP-N-acetylglucosamine 2-epimerase (non-hydrolyzing) [Melioribacteraceae bacterium]
MKVAPICREFLKHKDRVKHLICHTGQHYDPKMSDIFFNQLELPKPDYYLGVGSSSHAVQTAKIMIEFEQILIKELPDLVLVVGDVNSTIACTLTAKKLNIKCAHVESGLRSFDSEMPEEINRILTDRISDYLFVTEKSGVENLNREGFSKDKIFFVGNTMIDSLSYYLKKLSSENGVISDSNENYILATLHRPSNVDDPDKLKNLIDLLTELSHKRKVIFPIHPRTKKICDQHSLLGSDSENLKLIEPASYLDFISLMKNAELVITDSGGIQEETTFLGVQCITLRENTERSITIEIGTNQLLGHDLDKAKEAALNVLAGNKKDGQIPELWDGKAAERIVEVLLGIK